MMAPPLSPLPPDPWSIGLYRGAHPLHLAPSAAAPANPVMAREQVSDVAAAFVADPFLLPRDDGWHLFFEVQRHGGLGEIGWAHSPDGQAWRYGGIVLREAFHLSYPHVFLADGQVYMLPETLDAGAVRLYRADPFPQRWVPVADLIPGRLADPTPCFHAGRWYLFACDNPAGHDGLVLYHADALTGPWHPHPCSPLIRGDAGRARPAGRIIAADGALYRFAQDCGPRYGHGVRAFRITCLTSDSYADEPAGDGLLLGPAGHGWNGKGMHHIDAWPLSGGGWMAAVDGIRIGRDNTNGQNS